jgi:hypothetical protein
LETINIPKPSGGAIGVVLSIVMLLISLIGFAARTGQATTNNTADIQSIRDKMATKDDVEAIRKDIRILNKTFMDSRKR